MLSPQVSPTCRADVRNVGAPAGAGTSGSAGALGGASVGGVEHYPPPSGLLHGWVRQCHAEADHGVELAAQRQALQWCMQRLAEMGARLSRLERRSEAVDGEAGPSAREAASADLGSRVGRLEGILERRPWQSERAESAERARQEVSTGRWQRGGKVMSRQVDEAIAVKFARPSEAERRAESSSVAEAELTASLADVEAPGGASDDALVGAVLSTDAACKLGESLWDAALFIGSPLLPKADSALMALLIVATLIAQIVFLGITWLVFTKRQFTLAYRNKLEEWRMNIGQNVRYYDPLTFTSLTERICQPDRYISEMSSQTSSVFAQIHEYLGLHTFFNGPSLVKIALLLWGLTVVREFIRLWDLLRVLRALPSGSTQLRASSGCGRLVLFSMHRGRKAWAAAVLGIRALSAGSLFVFGCMFLSFHTISVSEIILNAVALEIVLKIDEAMFALVPRGTKVLLECLDPLPAPSVHSKVRGIDMRSLTFFVLVVVAIVVCYCTAIQEVTAQVRAANSTLCGGRTDFVYTLDPFYLVYVAKTNPMDVTQHRMRSYGHIQAINETIYPELMPGWKDGGGLKSSVAPMTFEFALNALAEVKKREAYDFSQASASVQSIAGTTCSDVFSVLPQAQRFVNASADAVGAPPGRGIESCADMTRFCKRWPLARALCPSTCGCDDPTGELFATGSSSGCPAACTAVAGAYRSSLEALPCVERTQQELASDPLWQEWARQFHYQVDLAWKYGRGRPCTNCTEYMMSSGCGIIAKWSDAVNASIGWSVDPCNGNWMHDLIGLKAVAAYCPVTCGCSGMTHEALLQRHCPGTCAASSR